MKKSIIALFAAATMATGVSAQDKAGENDAFGMGAFGGEEIATAAVVLGIGAAVVSNNRGTSGGDSEPPIECADDEELINGVCVPIATTTNTITVTSTNAGELTCNDGDVLIDDVCVGTTNTVTVSATQTVTVPVTFTYAPVIE